jgi:hypothetical protein
VTVLQAEAEKVTNEDQKAALARLIETKKVATEKDDTLLRALEKSKSTSKDAKEALKAANANAYKTSPRVAWFRDLIIWFFAFGLTGLGMQITFKSITQAGGQPLVIGTIVGTIKAVGSLIAVLMLGHILMA